MELAEPPALQATLPAFVEVLKRGMVLGGDGERRTVVFILYMLVKLFIEFPKGPQERMSLPGSSFSAFDVLQARYLKLRELLGWGKRCGRRRDGCGHSDRVGFDVGRSSAG